MKKLILLSFWALILGLFTTNLVAQSYPPKAIVYGTSPFQDSLWSFNFTGDTLVNNVPLTRMGPTLPGFVITGMNGMAYDPCEHKTYIIMKVSGVTGRVLGTIDLATGVCTQVGNLGTNFSSITFDRTGQLYGTTGNGGSPSETLFSIDKYTADTTVLTPLGNGADGEIICYNHATNMLYHWSGNGTVVYEKIDINAPYAVTGISAALTPSGETFGALYLEPNKFLISSISSDFRFIDTLGAVTTISGGLPDDLRGLVMLPNLAIQDDTICVNETVNIGAEGVYLFDVIYHWGDGSIDTVAAGGASHTYASSGTKNIVVLLDNGYCTPDTVWTTSVIVQGIPLVSLSGNPAICPSGSTTLTGSSGGTSQWYMNGVAISGEVTNTYIATTPGIYNMTKTNLNGCSDSASVGITTFAAPNPTVNLGNDTTVCAGLVLDAQNAGANYLWSNGATTQTINATNSVLYTVTVTDANDCMGNDDINLVVNPLPIVTLSGTDTICDGETATLTGSSGGSSQWYMNGAMIGGANSNTYNTSVAGVYNMVKTNANGCSDSSATSISLVVNALPVVSYLELQDTVCSFSSSFTLTAGNPANGTYSGMGVTGNSFDPAIGVGTYTITYTFSDANSCTDSSSAQIVVDVCSGLSNIASFANGLQIYPNPTTGLFTLELASTPNQTINLLVINTLGETVYQTQSQDQIQKIDLSALANGVYFIQISDSIEHFSAKIIKAN